MHITLYNFYSKKRFLKKIVELCIDEKVITNNIYKNTKHFFKWILFKKIISK